MDMNCKQYGQQQEKSWTYKMVGFFFFIFGWQFDITPFSLSGMLFIFDMFADEDGL